MELKKLNRPIAQWLLRSRRQKENESRMAFHLSLHGKNEAVEGER